MGGNWPCLLIDSPKNNDLASVIYGAGTLLPTFSMEHSASCLRHCKISIPLQQNKDIRIMIFNDTQTAVFKIFPSFSVSFLLFLKTFSSALSPPSSLVVLLRYRQYIHQGPPSPSVLFRIMLRQSFLSLSVAH